MKYGIEIGLITLANDEYQARKLAKILCDILKKYEVIKDVYTLCTWKIEEDLREECDGDCDNCKNQCETDPHEGCYSYPNCDIDPNGCCILMGDDVEPYGHRD